jgi:hypothetical protein
MKLKTVQIVVVMAFILGSHQVRAQDNLLNRETLSAAKIAGACGILDSLIQFQKTTKMNGGDEFVSKFWAVESTRLGLSEKHLSEQCDSAIVLYQNLWKSAEQKSK